MIKSEYDMDTGEATATAVGSSVIIRAEMKALRKLICNNQTMLVMWIEGLEEDIEELKSSVHNKEKTEEEARA